MLAADLAFRPIRLLGGYPPMEDLGLIGDGATTALVGLDGSIRWTCVPSFDSEPLFCALLDHRLGLLSEQIDPSTGDLTGDFPQAFSHIGVIAGGVTLERARGAAR